MADIYGLDRALRIWDEVKEEWYDTEYCNTESEIIEPLRQQTALLHRKSEEIYGFIKRVETEIENSKVY